MQPPESVDDYISTFPRDAQIVLQDVRQTIHAAAPGAKESISYQIPTFTIGGRPVVHPAGWKKHISVYPVPDLDESLVRQLALFPARAQPSFRWESRARTS